MASDMSLALSEIPDRQIEESIISAEMLLSRHIEIDCGDGEGCDTCCRVHSELQELVTEKDRRIAEDVYIPDPNEMSFEERFAPFGPEWQREQNPLWV